MRVFLMICTFICILFGFYKIFKDDEKGVAYAAFVFGVLTFLLTFYPFNETDIYKKPHRQHTETVKENTEKNEAELADDITEIENSSFSGRIEREQEIHKYKYIPNISGKYRFSFDRGDEQSNCRFAIYTDDNQELISSWFSEDGVTISLTKDEEYIIVVEQYSGCLEYTVTIGVPHEIQTINGNTLSGSFSFVDQEDRYVYTAPTTGTYRFDFVSSDIQKNYMFKMYSEDNQELASTFYGKEGVTVELKQDETYSISVIQHSGYIDYHITIGIPNEIKEISGTCFTGSMTYRGQIDRYTYVAPRTGKYRFDFVSDDVQKNYRFQILTKSNQEMASTYYTKCGVSVELVKGETYTINIEQYSGTLNYSVSIGIPNEIQEISKNSFSGSISYVNQENVYVYIAPITGVYRFDFVSDNTQTNYKFCVYSQDYKELVSTYYTKMGVTLELNKGSRYVIKVIQHSGVENYTINIGIPSQIVDVSENTIKGSIEYVDQENVYTYTASMTGKHTFSFCADDVTDDYKFYIISSINEKLVTTYYSKFKVSVDLEKGQIYKIIVKQYVGFPDYEITIKS